MTATTMEPTTHSLLAHQIAERQNSVLSTSNIANRGNREPRKQLTEDAPEWLSFARDFGTTYQDRTETTVASSAMWATSTLTTAVAKPRFDSHSRKVLIADAMENLTCVLKAHSDAPPEFEALRTAIKVIDALAFDRSPTPQIAYLHPQGIEIEWLVQNRSVTASCYSDGVLFIWGTDSDDVDLFEGEFRKGSLLSGDVYLQTVELLKLMGSDVRHRVSQKRATQDAPIETH